MISFMSITPFVATFSIAQITGGTVNGNFDSFSDATSALFWTTLPQGFAFAMIVWLLSASFSIVFKLVKKG